MLAQLNRTTALQEDFRMRPARPADLVAVTDLLNESAIAQTGAPEFTANELKTFWESPGFDMESGTRVIVSAQGEIVAYADLEDTAAIPVTPFLWGRVHPDYEGQGLGTGLLAWGEERAQQALARVPGDVRVALRTFSLSTHKPTKRLLEKWGMALIRHHWRMVIELDETPPSPLWPASISLSTRQERPDLLPIFRATDEAFRDHWGHVDQPEAAAFERFRHWVDNDEEHNPASWFLAMDGNEIAAVCLCRPTSHDDPDMAWVNTLGVRRPWRRQGLALALLHYTFGHFYRRGQKRVGLGVDASSLTGATRLYEKAGMHVSRQYDTYEKELRSGRDLSTQSVE